ncbi:hypothetical protein J2Z83_000452 [Virgibacillus natechei]|uniref:DUF6036 domain-containing protein n=1 Tax=Virgibacillus natechei TaxID=1216297 RepID=A0ABS4ICI9_9BACI|nr:DUF6036 family nucleotidyltransferase [Virgibacillus natechei]MBP1968360.1 hypothetical protein [Virgibacillus natechei]UZD13491.1 DUF6036 family nucleotidyltransferase [Virgibacillus natechei]
MMDKKRHFDSSKEIIEAMYYLDNYCILKNIHAEIVLMGGSAIMITLGILNGMNFRSTNDIDVETISTTDMDLLQESLDLSNIHLVGGIMEVPPLEDLKEKDNLYEIHQDFSDINLFVPNIEILACCKIFSKRQKDLDDLENTPLLDACDKGKLLEMVNEYKVELLNPNDPDLNVHQLDNIFRQRSI